jgi:hypothetical protein
MVKYVLIDILYIIPIYASIAITRKDKLSLNIWGKEYWNLLPLGSILFP